MVSICGKVSISDGECLTELHRYLNSTMVRNAEFAAAIKPPIFYEVARRVYVYRMNILKGRDWEVVQLGRKNNKKWVDVGRMCMER